MIILERARVLTNEELVYEIKNHAENAQELTGQLYEQNKGLLRILVRPFINAGMEEADAMQDAYFAIMDAIDHYDPTRGSFNTCLRYSILNTVGKNHSTVNLPVNMRYLFNRYLKLVQTFETEHGTTPPDGYIRHNLGISQTKLDDLRKVIEESKIFSLSSLIPGTEDLRVADTIADPTDIIMNTCDHIDDEKDARELWEAVGTLKDKQAEVIRIRYKSGRTIKETAKQLDTSIDKVRRAENYGLQRLRNKKSVQQIARDRGFFTKELYGGGLGYFRRTGTSVVERAMLRRIDEE